MVKNATLFGILYAIHIGHCYCKAKFKRKSVQKTVNERLVDFNVICKEKEADAYAERGERCQRRCFSYYTFISKF